MILVPEEEEDEMTRFFLYENLNADGYHVRVAPDRAKALALLSTAGPDLILLGAVIRVVAVWPVGTTWPACG